MEAVVVAQLGTFLLLSGKPAEYRKTADSGAIRLQGFCPQCGTAIYSTSDGDDSKAYAVRVGVVRQRYELIPRRQLFVRSQQAWVNNLNSITQFDKCRRRRRDYPCGPFKTCRRTLKMSVHARKRAYSADSGRKLEQPHPRAKMCLATIGRDSLIAC